MSGRSTVSADAEQRRLLGELAQSRDRGEADRARAILLTLSGWSGPRIAEAFGVAENTVRLWRMAFMREGVAALRTSPLGTRAIAYRPEGRILILVEARFGELSHPDTTIMSGRKSFPGITHVQLPCPRDRRRSKPP